MTPQQNKEISNKDLMDFMGGIAENVSGLKKGQDSLKKGQENLKKEVSEIKDTMATKTDLKNLKDALMEEIIDLKTELKVLSERTDEDDRATVHTIEDLQKRVQYLEVELKKLQSK